jgi:hypothetical protein
MKPRKPVVPKAVKPAMPKPKAAPKPAAPTGPLYYDQNQKLNPKGLYDKDGFMVRSSAPRDDFKKAAKPPADTDAAKRAGYLK